MPRFEPFRALRHAPGVDLTVVATPPYDVISAAERETLAAQHPANMVHVDVPPEGGHARAGQVLRAWVANGVLQRDPVPTLTVYRMTSPAGDRSTGVIGALELMEPGAGDVLPHERTTPKAASDRLELLRATNANLSPIWGLSMAGGLGRACDEVAGTRPADAAMTDADGVRHEAWVVDDAVEVERICGLVAAHPVVVADGHHRYQTSLAYHRERADAGATDAHDVTLAFVVELAPEHLHVRAIHRLLRGLPADVEPAVAFAGSFDHAGTVTADDTLLDRMVAVGALAFVRPDGTATLLRPVPGAFDGLRDLDSLRLDTAVERAGLSLDITYQHGLDRVLAALRAGAADAAVLLRPVTVATIETMARHRELMPPKSTFFAPKPRTGFVIRTM